MLVLAGDWSPGNFRVSVELEYDLLIANLEGPIAPDLNSKPRSKAGPHLFSKVIPHDVGKMAFTLANNHSMDFGAHALENTMRQLAQRGAIFSGFGRNRTAARQPTYFEHENLRWAWLSACEPQFGVATGSRAGVAGIGAWMLPAVESASNQADFVIVSVHAGNEDLPWPSPQTVDFYRELAEAGASIVHGHHSHVPQGFERYKNCSIFYGLGNFAVDPNVWAEISDAQWSNCVRFDSSLKDPWVPEAVHVKYDSPTNPKEICVAPIPDKQLSEVSSYFAMANAPIQDPQLLEGVYQEAAFSLYTQYGANFMDWEQSPLGTLREMFRKYKQSSTAKVVTHTMDKFRYCSPDKARLRYHMIVNDSHRNMLVTVLGVLGGELEDFRGSHSKKVFNAYRARTIESI